jgi:non-heme Fe2+,alpha-ketoglutarate-dependent halogenase
LYRKQRVISVFNIELTAYFVYYNMRNKLSATAYHQQGIDWPIQAFNPAQAQSFSEQYYDFQRQSLAVRGKETHIKPHLISTWFDEIVHHPLIVDAVAQAIGPEIVLWTSDIANKETGKETWVPWHQDTPYWNLSDTNVVSVWLALTCSKIDNGAMRVVPATHKHGALGSINVEGDPHEGYKQGVRTSSKGNIFAYDYVTNHEVDEALALDVELDPGQFSLHNIELMHGGGPNPSVEDRVGFVMRFMAADTYCHSGVDSVTAIRGDTQRDHFVFEARPKASFSSEAVQVLSTALQYPSGFGDRKVQ